MNVDFFYVPTVGKSFYRVVQHQPASNRKEQEREREEDV